MAMKTIVKGLKEIKIMIKQKDSIQTHRCFSGLTHIFLKTFFLMTHKLLTLQKELTFCRKMFIYLPETLINMNSTPINRLKVVLAEQGKTNKWLAEKLNKNERTISR
jgi:hypothetical protein